MQIKASISCQVRDYVEAFRSFEDDDHGADERCGIWLLLMEGVYVDGKVTVYPPA